jgi:hypothetical protein
MLSFVFVLSVSYDYGKCNGSQRLGATLLSTDQRHVSWISCGQHPSDVDKSSSESLDHLPAIRRHASLTADLEEGFIPPRTLLPPSNNPCSLSHLTHNVRQHHLHWIAARTRASLPVQPDAYITGPSQPEEASHNTRAFRKSGRG